MARSTKLIVLAAVFTIVAAACNSRPLPPEFASSTTSPSTTIPLGTDQPATTIALPPLEEQVVGTVVSVIDGDTLEVIVDGASTEVRLMGINAPELDECWGPESADLLTTLVGDKEILLVPGATDTDEFGRLLRYAYIQTADGTDFVNAIQVSDGAAVALHDGGEQAAMMKSLEAGAYNSGRGMWGTVVCGDEEAIRADKPVVRVATINYDPTGPDESALDEEFVTFENEGYGRVDFTGWTLRDETSTNRFTFPRGSVIAPGAKITVVTGCSTDEPATATWCANEPVWSNSGDTVIVQDSVGNVLIWFTYDGDGS